jgi:Ca2+-binding RTX toxin-like protein
MRSTTRQVQLTVEALEARAVPATGVFRNALGRIVIEGTAGDDLVVVSATATEVHVDLNGTVTPFALQSVKGFRFLGLDGNDQFTSTLALPTWLLGGAGNDTLTGGSKADVLRGEDGDDVLDSGLGNDLIYGGFGNDIVQAGDGADIVYGGDGNDLLQGGAGADVIRGGFGDDNLQGSTGKDTMFGGAGTDVLQGDEDADFLYGGLGFDAILGGAGRDSLFGGDGRDTLTGGLDQDSLFGGAAPDQWDLDAQDRYFENTPTAPPGCGCGG